MLQSFCEVAPDYLSLLHRLRDPASIRAVERIVQFPYVVPTAEEKTEEELAHIAERRREQGKKLQELAAKARLEKACIPYASILLEYNHSRRSLVDAKGKRPPNAH